MCSDYMDTQQEMFQFVTVTLESPLYLLIQRHYTSVPLFFLEAVVRKNGKENRNQKISGDTVLSWSLQWKM